MVWRSSQGSGFVILTLFSFPSKDRWTEPISIYLNVATIDLEDVFLFWELICCLKVFLVVFSSVPIANPFIIFVDDKHGCQLQLTGGKEICDKENYRFPKWFVQQL